MIAYRIYTEDVNRAQILELADSYFQGYSVLIATGVWRGKHEPSLILELLAFENDKHAVTCLAQDIKALNKQESVLVSQNVVQELFI